MRSGHPSKFSATWIFSLITLAVSQIHMGNKIVLTNDDGWAVAMIRAQNDALKSSGFDVVLSCPAENESGTGSSTASPTVLNVTCEFDTCPVGSPPEGFNASDPRLNYVNSFPVDAVRFGLHILAPKFFGGLTSDFVVSGPNVGNNLGSAVLGSGTVGAACEAALEGHASAAFSAQTASQVAFTTLDTDPTSQNSRAAHIYGELTVIFSQRLLANLQPLLPPNITLNVNYAATDNCTSVSDFSFVLTRVNANATATDVETCGTNHLPDETTVVTGTGCHASVSVLDANLKTDVDANTQRLVLNKLTGLLTCFETA